MAGYTLAQAQAQLDAWMAASLAVAGSQRYSIGDRELTRADAGLIQQNIKFWRDEVNRLTASASGRRRTRYVVIG
jgi:hypothetical protein